MIEGLTEMELHALVVACETTDLVADKLAERNGSKRKRCARDTARVKLIITLGTWSEAVTGLKCLN